MGCRQVVAPGSGPGIRGFESLHPSHEIIHQNSTEYFTVLFLNL